MDFDFTTETITSDITNLLTVGGTGGFRLPSGPTALRPIIGLANGVLRYNSDTKSIEGYVDNSWAAILTGDSAPNLAAGTVGAIPYQSATSTTAFLAATASGNVLLSGGITTAPLWGKVPMDAAVSGILPVANGGTGSGSTPANGEIDIGNGAGFARTTLTAGENIVVTNAAGEITISATPTYSSLYYNTALTSTVAYNQGPIPVEISGATLTVSEPGNYWTYFLAQYYVIPVNVASQCALSLQALTTQINGLTATGVLGGLADGTIITPGVWDIAGAVAQNGTITFDGQGNPDSVFVLRIGGAFSTTAASIMAMIDEAQSCNIFFLVSGAVSSGANATVKGTLIAYPGAVAMGDGINLDGRLFSSTGAITTTNSVLNVPTPVCPTLALGNLHTFALFTVSGAISNTGTNSGSGDITTGVGVITNYSMIGTIYLPSDLSASATFTAYNAGVSIPTSAMSVQYSAKSNYQQITCVAIATATIGDAISIRIAVDVGTVVLKNRSLFLNKVSPG
jgi:hypothetical protein